MALISLLKNLYLSASECFCYFMPGQDASDASSYVNFSLKSPPVAPLATDHAADGSLLCTELAAVLLLCNIVLQ